MKYLGWINFILFQWFFVRLAKVYTDDKFVRWAFVFAWPLSRWVWPDFLRRFIFGRQISYSVVSLYGNPIHEGHVQYINAAKQRGDKLIAIVNTDAQVRLKKSVRFMDEDHRLSIISNLKSVDFALKAIDSDKTVCETLDLIRYKYPNNPLTFFNSGDRQGQNLESAERKTCEELNIRYKVIPLPKIFSSSKLINDACAQINKT